MVVLVICKNDGDPYKNEGTRMLTTFLPFKDNGDFSRRSKAANSAVLCWILLNPYPFGIFWLYSLPARIKKSQLKMEELECSQDFPIITHWELSVVEF